MERAIEEFQQYLSDLLPPLVVSDSLHFLMNYPDITAANVYSWVNSQLRSGRAVSMNDYFFHALKKIHLMGEYHLLPKEELLQFLEKLRPLILAYCPANERQVLAENLNHLDDVSSAPSSSVDHLYRQQGSQESVSTAPSSETPAPTGDFQQLSLLMSKLEKELQRFKADGDASAEQKKREVLLEGLAQAARSARASVELDRSLDEMRRFGIAVDTGDIFQALGSQLPEWAIAVKPGVQLPEDSNLKAMHRIVTQAPDPKEAATRFNQMIRTAVERFNRGHIEQAVSMIETAEKIIAEKQIQEVVSENIRHRGHEDLDVDALRKYAESPEQHASLRTMLRFFSGYSVSGLLESLYAEPKRDRRRLYLALLEAYGDETRQAALEAIRAPLTSHPTNEEIYIRRNLLYLLKRIPASPTENEDDLCRLVADHASLGTPILILKEAIAYLGQLKSPVAESALVSLLNELESSLLSSNDPPKKLEATQLLLDRVASSIARMGSPAAHAALLDHGFKRKPKLGDTIGRIGELSGQDLSTDPQSVERLIQGLKDSLPKKLLGFVIQERDHDIESIVKALSGTTSDAARNALAEIAQQFPDRRSGQAAAKKITERPEAVSIKRPAEPTSSLSGDLNFFSLPSLLQSLSDNDVTGTLTLKTHEGEVFGKLLLDRGKLTSCEASSLKGDSAFYQLLERPRAGTFQFVRILNPQKQVEGQAVLPLILEGVRRYDELREADALLPNHARLAAKSDRPVQLAEERDGLLFRELWNAVRNGATPHECEAAVETDAYRVRRLLVHWIETGCIENIPS